MMETFVAFESSYDELNVIPKELTESREQLEVAAGRHHQ